MSLLIELVSYQQAFALPKAFILERLSESLLAEALRSEPDVATLPIREPVVTPTVMQVLVDLATGKEPSHHQPALVEADRYLNLAPVMGYASPRYDQLLVCPCPLKYISEAIIPADDVALFQHLHTQAAKDEKLQLLCQSDILQNYYHHALKVGASQILQYLLTRLKPTVKDLETAIAAKQASSVHVLLKDGRVDPTARNGNLLGDAVETGVTEIVKLFLKDGRADPTVFTHGLLYRATNLGYVEMVKLFLADPRVDPRKTPYFVLGSAHRRFAEMVKVYWKDGRVDLTSSEDIVLRRAIRTGEVELVRKLLQWCYHRGDAPQKYQDIAVEEGNVAMYKLLSGEAKSCQHRHLNIAIRLRRQVLAEYLVTLNPSQNVLQRGYMVACGIENNAAMVDLLYRQLRKPLVVPPFQLGDMMASISKEQFEAMLELPQYPVGRSYLYLIERASELLRRDLQASLERNKNFNPEGLSAERLMARREEEMQTIFSAVVSGGGRLKAIRAELMHPDHLQPQCEVCHSTYLRYAVNVATKPVTGVVSSTTGKFVLVCLDCQIQKE